MRGQWRGGQDAGSPLATSTAAGTGQDVDVLLDELLSRNVAEDPGTNKPGRTGLRARQQRPDTAYIGTPYATDRALVQQQQQQQYIEPLAWCGPIHRPSLSTGHPPSSPYAPPLPQQHHQLPALYSNSLYGPDTEHHAPAKVHSPLPSPSPSPPSMLLKRGHKRTISATAAAAGPSPRARPSPKATATALEAAYVGAGSTHHGHPEVENEEREAGSVGLLQQLSQKGGKLLRSGNRVGLFGGAASGATKGSTRILEGCPLLDKRGAAKSRGGAGDDEAMCGVGGAGLRARRLLEPEEEEVLMGGAVGGNPLVAEQGGPVGRDGPDLVALGGTVSSNTLGGPSYGGSYGGSSLGEAGFAGAASIKRVEDALLWRDPWLSARALAGGLYLIVCLQQAVKASKYLRPTTLILAAAFLILVANLAAAAYRAFRHAAHRHTPNHHHHHHHHHKLVGQHNWQPLHDPLPPNSPTAGAAQPPPRSNQRRPHGSEGGSKQPQGRQHRARQRWGEVRNGSGGGEGEVLLGGNAFGVAQGLQNSYRVEQEGEGELGGLGRGLAIRDGVRSSRMMRHAMEQERLVYEWTHLILSALTGWAVPLAAACCAVVYRALSGRRLATTVLVAGSLWLGMLLSELDVVSPATFCGLMYTTLFTLPASYLRCRQAMDGAVDTILRFLARLLVSGDRASLLLTTTTLLLVFSTTSFSLVSRVSLALVCAMCVLVYTTLFRQSSRQAGRA